MARTRTPTNANRRLRQFAVPDAQTQVDRAQIRAKVTEDEVASVFTHGAFIPDPSSPTSPGAPTPLRATHAPSPLTFSDGTNLLANGVFEDLDGNGDPFDTVRGWEGDANTLLSQSDAEAHDGDYSLALEADDAGTLSANTALVPGRDEIKVIPGWTYRVTAHVKAESTSRTIRLTVDFYDATETDLSAPVQVSAADSSSEWTLLDTLPFQAPAGAAYAVLTVDSASSVADGEIHYVDDVEVKAVSGLDGDTTVFAPGNVKSENFETGVSGWAITGAGDAEFNDVRMRGQLLGTNGPNLLDNHDFEVDASHWTAESGWTISRSTDEAKEGTASLKIHATSDHSGTDIVAKSDPIPVTEGLLYAFGGWILANVTSKSLYVGVTWYDENDDPVGGSLAEDWGWFQESSASEWRPLASSGLTTAGAVSARVHIGIIDGDDNTDADQFLDELFFSEASDIMAARFQTSDLAHRRAVMEESALTLYTGSADEDDPASIEALFFGNQHGMLKVDSPKMGGARATLTMNAYAGQGPDANLSAGTAATVAVSGEEDTVYLEGNEVITTITPLGFAPGQQVPHLGRLAMGQWNPPSPSGYQHASAGVWLPVDAANVRIYPHVPPSGRMQITLQGFMGMTDGSICYWGVYDVGLPGFILSQGMQWGGPNLTINHRFERDYTYSGALAGTQRELRWYWYVSGGIAIFHHGHLMDMKAEAILGVE